MKFIDMEKKDLRIGEKYKSLIDTVNGRRRGEIIEITEITSFTVRYKRIKGASKTSPLKSFLTECIPEFENESYEIY